MALPPKFAGHKLLFAPPPVEPSSSVPHTTHTLELYLDYCCPFSAKLFRALRDVVTPLVEADPSRARGLAVVFRQQVQPWHPSSTLMHEAALAVLRLAPDRFWDFSAALFAAQRSFFDVSVVAETRNDTYRRLAAIAGSASVGLDPAAVYELLAIPDRAESDDALNVGNAVTNDLKLVTKMNRLVGVHVTPTGVFDGVVQDIGSAWGEEEWKEWLTKNVV
ncbi:Thioredoxin-like protein [Cordyceps javanica]|uniref:Thioredoxin-like protein n=1 Tax=Cordyceps javanica TaxID=43265 RepID=A0A545V420_9HYPO|nr:Thioredoxin-like protein [Cordyceps javanica]TQW07747.1 Thioredoxin-like protein [Cordyceps javanica]